MNEIFEPLQNAVRYYRLGMDGVASDYMVHFIDAFSMLMTQERVKAKTPELAAYFGRVIDAQLKGDTLRIADILEYELMPLIGELRDAG